MSKFSSDPKIKIISCKEFLEDSNYLHDCNKNSLLCNVCYPIFFEAYYKITNNLLICVVYKPSSGNYGKTVYPCLDHIKLAFRNGVDEYHCFDDELQKAKLALLDHPKSAKLTQLVKEYENAIRYINRKLPPFVADNKSDKRGQNFAENILNNLVTARNKELANKYVVLDLETNGLRFSNDDLLSLTIFDPEKGEAYNRFLPLELQPVVLTKYINGIDDEMLVDKLPLSQQEFYDIVDYFNLKNRTILTYSGGNFDEKFLCNYLKRHKILGADILRFENIKDLIVSNAQGAMSKDNLCKVFNIDGITETHSGLNDCILEWKLFEKIYGEQLLIINNNMYKFSKDYIVPVSYLVSYNNIAHLANIMLPNLNPVINKEFEMSLSRQALAHIKKFGSNIDGIAIETILFSALNAKKCDNYNFLLENLQKLKYVGSLEDNNPYIPITIDSDWVIQSVNKKDRAFVKEVNASTELLKTKMEPLIKFLKQIFNKQQVLSQELVISDDKKVLALCDLSTANCVVEIKAFDIFANKKAFEQTIKQLYYQKKNRDSYILSIQLNQVYNTKTYRNDLNDIKLIVYSVLF